MSGHEPGHAPRNRRTTAEFGAPRLRPDEPDGTAVDAPLDPDATSVDPEAGSADATAVDVPSVGGRSESGAAETVTDTAAMPAAGAPGAVPAGDERPWTAEFGAEAQAAAPGEPSSVGQVPPVPYTLPAEAEAPAAAPQPPPSGQAGSERPTHEPTADALADTARTASASPPFGVSAGPPPAGPKGRRRVVVLAAVLAAAAVVAVGGLVALKLRDGDGEPAASPRAPSASSAGPQGGAATSAPPAQAEPTPSETAPSPPSTRTPAPGGGAPDAGAPTETPPEAAPPATPPARPVLRGDGVTYRVVQEDPGYFEGEFVLTNRTGGPLTTWRIAFDAPGANVKNIWGGRLVRGGAHVEIENLPGAPAIPPGAEFKVRFGAEGAPSGPDRCRVNGSPCGF